MEWEKSVAAFFILAYEQDLRFNSLSNIVSIVFTLALAFSMPQLLGAVHINLLNGFEKSCIF